MGSSRGANCSYETHAEPIKLGILMDWVVPADHPQERVDDWFLPLELVFGEGLKQGVIDRPVELVVRRCWGLPKGSVKAVVDAYAELVEAGCLAVFGPSISDNCVPIRGTRSRVGSTSRRSAVLGPTSGSVNGLSLSHKGR